MRQNLKTFFNYSKSLFYLIILLLINLNTKAGFFSAWSKQNAQNRSALWGAITGDNSASRYSSNNSQESLDSKKSFKDIIGGVPQEIQDLISILKEDENYKALGIEAPKGILFVGPPGTGKTLLAGALAGELNYDFISASAAEFETKWVGSGVENIKNLFDSARQKIKSGDSEKVIIFIDEIDSIGHRSHEGSNGTVAAEFNRTINELLLQMDGFFPDAQDTKANKNIIVIGATNHEYALDPALRRAGRFSRVVNIPLPDQEKREKIIKYYLESKNRNIENNIDFNILAKHTQNFNCADLADMVERSAVRAARDKRKVINNSDFEKSIQDIINQKNRTY